MKLLKLVKISGIIEVVNGLRIGGTKESLDIGAMDNPIIRNPITNLPYIPGSSLKGKMRCLLEQKEGRFDKNRGGPCNCGQCDICQLFGSLNSRMPTRIIVRDAMMTQEWEQKWSESKEDLAEIKTETAIDRRSGRVLRGSLRTQERIPPGVQFEMEMILRIYKDDDENKFKKMITSALDLLEKDYLGSSGTRGYGKITIKDLKFEEIPINPNGGNKDDLSC